MSKAQRKQQRELPHSIEAERSVLGAMLLNPDAAEEAITILGQSAAPFYYEPHRKLYAVMLSIQQRNTPIDAVTLLETLQQFDALQLVGGASYVSELSGAAPTSANVAYYADIVRQKWLLRSLCERTSQIYYGVFGATDARAHLDEAERMIHELSDMQHSSHIQSLQEVLPAARDSLKKIAELKGKPSGIPSGYVQLDALTFGWQPGDFVIVAARPSAGKTAFMVNIGHHASDVYKSSVLIFSLEMPAQQLANRLICLCGGVSIQKLAADYLPQVNIPRIDIGYSQLLSSHIHIDDNSELTLHEMRSKIRRHVKRHGPTLVLLDYVQLMRLGYYVRDRHQEVAEISRGIKAVARQLKVPIIALCQLSREADKIVNPFSKLGSLRESGALEQDADVVIILNQPDERTVESMRDHLGQVITKESLLQVTIAKHRNGPIGQVYLHFDRATQRISSLQQVVSAQPPTQMQAPLGPPPMPRSNSSRASPLPAVDYVEEDDDPLNK